LLSTWISAGVTVEEYERIGDGRAFSRAKADARNLRRSDSMKET
jgi:hypothetical protein